MSIHNFLLFLINLRCTIDRIEETEDTDLSQPLCVIEVVEAQTIQTDSLLEEINHQFS